MTFPSTCSLLGTAPAERNDRRWIANENPINLPPVGKANDDGDHIRIHRAFPRRGVFFLHSLGATLVSPQNTNGKLRANNHSRWVRAIKMKIVLKIHLWGWDCNRMLTMFFFYFELRFNFWKTQINNKSSTTSNIYFKENQKLPTPTPNEWLSFCQISAPLDL